MTRTTAREIAVRLIFGLDSHPGAEEETISNFFDDDYYSTLAEADELYAKYPDKKQLAYITELVRGVSEKREELDGIIEKYSHSWKAKRISRTALSVLRCAIYEIMYMDEVPDSAAINEAVELSKDYEEPETVAFINGVLGGMMRGEQDDAQDAEVSEDEDSDTEVSEDEDSDPEVSEDDALDSEAAAADASEPEAMELQSDEPAGDCVETEEP